MKKIFVLACFVLPILVGCVGHQQQAITLNSPFSVLTASSLMKDGGNTIKGSALMRQVGGGVVNCAGQKVLLIPVTGYAIERLSYFYGTSDSGVVSAATLQMQPKKFLNEDPNYFKYMKEAICDAQGYFKFEKVADGDFFLVASITWKVGGNSLYYEGGGLMKKVHVEGSELKEFVLAP